MMRTAQVKRHTSETKVEIDLNIDGDGICEIDTGIGFLDHMIGLFAYHGGFDLKLKCSGDIYVDDHHTVEDIGICLGEALKIALKDKRGIKRYASMYIPMDESLCLVAIDISNRPFLVYNINFDNNNLGSVSCQNFKEFFRAFVNESRITLHMNLIYGENDHHKIEAAFKGLGRVLKEGCNIIGDEICSTKGVL